jgi:hypothetical protein
MWCKKWKKLECLEINIFFKRSEKKKKKKRTEGEGKGCQTGLLVGMVKKIYNC